jgi:hypothetical protein
MVKPALLIFLHRLDRVAVGIDCHQARGGDLVEQQAERIEQEAVLIARQPRAQVGENQVIHAEMGEQTIGGREVAANFPLLRIDIAH